MISDIFIPFWCETEEKAAPILSDRADEPILRSSRQGKRNLQHGI
ncbi:hypothetical protein [Bradyrhizobium septentrionale]|nr:hypothetical protein [Bradyrhizobium septentrionale]